MGGNLWQNTEKETLKELYAKEKNIKNISSLMGRTENCIRKALYRLNLKKVKRKRNRDNIQEKFFANGLSSILSSSCSSVGGAIEKLTSVFKSRKKSCEYSFFSQWVSFPIVIEWLQDQGIKISQSSTNSFFMIGGPYYLVNNHLLSKGQLLLFANRQRLQQGLPCFQVKGVTQ